MGRLTSTKATSVLLRSASACLLLAVAAPCFAQSANKVIDAAVRAQGGKKILQQLRTSEWQGTVTESGVSETGSFTLLTESPNRFYREIVLGPEHDTEACNGKSCWGQSSENNFVTLVGEEEKLAKAEALFLNLHLLDLKKNKIRSQLLPAETAGRSEANVVELTTATGVIQRLDFDVKSHLVIQEVLSGGNSTGPPVSAAASGTASPVTSPASNTVSPEEITFSDFRPVQGVREPFYWQIKQGTKTYDINFTRISLNGAVSESAFNFPALSTRPLPDIATLLKTVNANQKQIDERKKDYACMEQEIEQNVDGMGKIKKQSLNLYQVSYVAGHEIDRQIEKDGKPFAAAEQQKEDTRIQKDVARYEKEATDAGKKKKKQEDDDVGIEDFLRISKFSNPRWERFRGQDVVVFDFGPNPDYKPKKLAEKALHDLSGVVWIDPNANDVVRLEARFDNSFKIAGGMLASLQKGAAFVFEQTLVNNEVWLPSYDEEHLGVKLLLVKTIRDDEIHRYYDYKRFQVSTKENIGKPHQQ
jgi:hypothetical protein